MNASKGIQLAITLVFTLFLYGNSANAGSLKDSLYDVSIRKWASVYTPSYPWYWNKAQLKAESNLDTNATSPVGAMGLGQFMPDTWMQVKKELGLCTNAKAYTAPLNIQAHAYYMSKLRSMFKKDRPEYDRHSLALASYNAGQGNVFKAQALAGNTLLWTPTSRQLHKVTGKHHKETITYVNRIWKYIQDYEHNYN